MRSIKSILIGFGAGCAACVLAACTALPVKTDINPNMSVSNCHSYAFADEHAANMDQASAFGNPLNSDRLRVAIESNMAAKGIGRVADRKSAECIVGYAMGTRQVFDDYYGGFGPGWGWGGGWGGWGWGGRGWGGFGGGFGDDIGVRDETRISVDLFDARSRVPIWHASVSQSVGDLRGPNAVQKITAAANAIFTKFPLAGSPVASGVRSST